jgi:hypothetical protein
VSIVGGPIKLGYEVIEEGMNKICHFVYIYNLTYICTPEMYLLMNFPPFHAACDQSSDLEVGIIMKRKFIQRVNE